MLSCLPPDSFPISMASKNRLLAIARTSIKDALTQSATTNFEITDTKLLDCHGLFVSLYFRKQLRGCIGCIKSDQPLYEVTAQMAVSAATNAPRFLTVSADEIDELKIKIELSVLTLLQLVTNINLIKIGQHGFYIVSGHQNGLLLPQVAISYHLDRQNFLKQTCLKAGLPDNAWQFNKTEIYVFGAEVFIQ